MGCCQDKDLQNGQKATRSQSEDEEDGAREKAAGGISLSLGSPEAREGVRGGGERWGGAQGFLSAGDEAQPGARDERMQRSNDSIMITVLWRRLSMFSRRGSRRQSMLKQGAPGTPGRDLEPDGIPEEASTSEKG